MASHPDRSAPQPGEASISASGRLQTWGYHNTFSTHAATLPDSEPPNYGHATSPRSSSQALSQSNGNVSEQLPQYVCNTHFEGFLDMKTELATPFLISHDNEWHSVYVQLYGTQLHLYRVKKSFFKSKVQRQGRLIKTYSLQHAEIGIAVDWRKGDLVPKATFARVLPKQAQLKLYETDPELFEPVREFVFRLRIEQEQLIFCAPSHATMLDWVEQICVGIDISPPLDDRHEPRFRSLPRRTRRQRQIENAAQNAGRERDDASREEAERQFIAEQEEIFARLYPQLATTTVTTIIEQVVTEERNAMAHENDTNEFDREDVLGESPESIALEQNLSQSLPELDDEVELYDPKTASARPPMSYNALCRFRRRCAPILLASSPRASHVIFTNGNRYQIDGRRCKLVPFVTRPPRYESHKFNDEEILAKIEEGKLLTVARPGLSRGVTGASQWSNTSTDVEAEEGGEAASVHTTNSANEELDRIDTVVSTTEASPMASKGKLRAIVVAKVSASPLKAIPRNRHDDSITLAAAAPLFV